MLVLNNRKIKKYFILFFIHFFLSSFLYSQDPIKPESSKECPEKDLSDIIRSRLHKAPKEEPKNSNSLLLIPIIGSNPATGFMIGVGGQYAFKMHGSSLYSAFSGSALFTSKKQAIFLLKNNFYTKENKIFFSGDWRYLIYSQSTYGLGTNSPEGGILQQQYDLAGQETSIDSLAQPMKFNFIRLHQSSSFKIKESLYLGVGYFLDSYSKIVDQKLRLGSGDSLITSHYAYSKYYGYDSNKYLSSAINVNIIYDTRDNMVNPYSGYYIYASWRGAFEAFGNVKGSNFVQLEYRSFHPLSKTNPRHLLAFWGLGNFCPAGEFPYLILPATAYDQRSRSARGYTQGRYRGNNLVYGEAEYRFPISPCGGILGGVVFVNGTTANNEAQDLKLFQSVKPGYGLGLRIMVDKKSRTNLAVDIGFGEKSFGFYLAASETF
jgi:hypothetical protein